jgi:hypothetical protein
MGISYYSKTGNWGLDGNWAQTTIYDLEIVICPHFYSGLNFPQF